jgi:hypothetical protein
VVAVRPSGRSFLVMKENSKISRRNRKFLKLREATPDDANIDLECAGITVVENRYSDSTPRRRESCLLRRPTERRMQTRSPGTCLARRVFFSTATTIKAVSVGADGRDFSLSETIAFASKVVHRINFGPVTGG